MHKALLPDITPCCWPILCYALYYFLQSSYSCGSLAYGYLLPFIIKTVITNRILMRKSESVKMRLHEDSEFALTKFHAAT